VEIWQSVISATRVAGFEKWDDVEVVRTSHFSQGGDLWFNKDYMWSTSLLRGIHAKWASLV